MKISSRKIFQAFIILGFIYTLIKANNVYLAILAAVVSAFILYPLVNKITKIKLIKYRIPVIPAIFIAFFIAIFIVVGIASILVIPLVEEIEKLYKNIPQMMITIDRLLTVVKNDIIIPIVNSGMYREQ